MLGSGLNLQDPSKTQNVKKTCKDSNTPNHKKKKIKSLLRLKKF
jgi:hypothetical protein